MTAVEGRTAAHLNVGCGTHYAPEPWLNLDVHSDDTTTPDQLVSTEKPYPFPTCSADRIFLGHVLEHLQWERVPFFLQETHRVLKPGGQLVACGPDVHRALVAWKADLIPVELMHSVLEHAEYPYPPPAWPEALHHWNCTGARVELALRRHGFAEVAALDAPPVGFPAVGFEPMWQFCVTATKGSR